MNWRALRNIASVMVLMSVILGAEKLRIENHFLEVRTGEEDILISQLTYLPRELTQLRESRQEESMLMFVQPELSEEGIRVFEIKGDNKLPLTWGLQSSGEHGAEFESADGKWITRLQLPLDGVYFDLEFYPVEPLKEKVRLEVVSMLEVGGTFLGVPTEGPADYLMVPVSDDSEQVRIQRVPVPRSSDVGYTPILPWWAVGDQVADCLLVCTVEPQQALISLHQWSGIVETTEGFRQSMTLEFVPGNPPVVVRIYLFDKIHKLSGISHHAVWALRYPQQANHGVTLTMIPAIPIDNVQVALELGKMASEVVDLDKSAVEPNQSSQLHFFEQGLPQLSESIAGVVEPITVRLTTNKGSEQAILGK